MRTSAYLTIRTFVLFLRGLRRGVTLNDWLLSFSCLPPLQRQCHLSTLLPVSVPFHKGEDVSEVLEFKQACVGKGILEETDPGSGQLREG